MRPRFAKCAGVLLGACLLTLSGQPRARAHESPPSKYSYWKDVYPILRARCADCHVPGGAAPMNLLRYDEAFPWAASIKVEVLEGRMPPWLPEEGWGEHVGARRLTAQEIDVLVDWAGGGAPQGAPTDPTERTGASEEAKGPGWALGEPDQVLEPPVEARLPAEQAEATTCWVAPIGNRERRWLAALDLQPGNSEIVRAARVDLAAACSLEPESRPLLVWVAGQKAIRLPREMGEPIPAGARLAVTLRYRKSWRDDGKEVRDRSRVGLYFAARAQRLGAFKLDAPSRRLERALAILSVWPIRSREGGGEPVHAEALLPDGRTICLLHIQSFRGEWLTKYFFPEPLTLPMGSELRASPPGVWIEYRDLGVRKITEP